ncbi:hypothetical protein KIN20_037529 [Parelaphostrongylus tenuis]|uniref:Uncharacterized protein n=1 Tax=Parelaphostrongylus tenuis TaxID=148309 RepID=A0AAD5WLD5_PARTN|nr:hypothetical protein KIN20_037529 [Parelaphostrongylus tenuis]
MKQDPTEDYEFLDEGFSNCAKFTSVIRMEAQTFFITFKELLEKRRERHPRRQCSCRCKRKAVSSTEYNDDMLLPD